MTVILPEQDGACDLDLFGEFEIVCDVPGIVSVGEPHCDYNPAEWIAYRTVVCQCGIIVRLVCTQCKEMYQWAMARHAHLSCPGCGDETKGFDRFEPIKKAS
jgi:hypothetical protein